MAKKGMNITLELGTHEAEALARLAKRAGWSEHEADSAEAARWGLRVLIASVDQALAPGGAGYRQFAGKIAGTRIAA